MNVWDMKNFDYNLFGSKEKIEWLQEIRKRRDHVRGQRKTEQKVSKTLGNARKDTMINQGLNMSQPHCVNEAKKI